MNSTSNDCFRGVIVLMRGAFAALMLSPGMSSYLGPSAADVSQADYLMAFR